jgi:hypothetical protein
MALIPFDVLPVKDPAGGSVPALLVRWPSAASAAAGVTPSDTCVPYLAGNFENKTIDVIGTLGTSWGMEGTNDPALTTGSFKALRDAQGVAITGLTTLSLRTIGDNCYAIRPATPVGGTASHTYLLLLQSTGR